MSLDTELILGKDVVVNGVSTLGHVKIDNSSEKGRMQASNLGGGVDRPDGIRMLKGYYYAYGDTPPVFVNDLFNLTFTLNGLTGTQNTSVRCLGLEIFANAYEPGKDNLVFYVVHFGGAGVDFTTGSAAGDNTAPSILNTKGLGLNLSGAVLPYIAGMHLKIEALADPDWNSSLNGIAFYPRGDIDWMLDWTQRVNEFSLTPDLDSIHAVTMQTNGLVGWHLEYGKLGKRGGTFDHKTKLPLTMDYILEKCSNGADLGSITDPSGATKWGP